MNDDDDKATDDAPIYQVGYGKPPVHTRFKPGQSGNPKGKIKGTRGLKAIISDILNEKIPVRTAHGTKKMTKLEALIQTSLNSALKGDAKATAQVLKLAREAGLADEVADALHAATMLELTQEDRAILERFRGRGAEAISDDTP